MPLTLAQAKSSRLNRISGICPDSDDFLELLNDATRQLMRRGNWWGTVRKIRLCVYEGCFALPAYVGTVLATNLNHHPVKMSNHWFEFIPVQQTDWCCDRKWVSNIAAELDGTTPVFQNIPCNPAMKVRAYPRCQSDLGKTLTIYGIDSNGWPVRTERSDGTIQDGELITLVLPYADTDTFWRTITRVDKDVTDCPVDLFAHNLETDSLIDLAHYMPHETNPDYRHLRIHSGCGATTGCCPATVTMLIKLAFVPVTSDSDLVLIDNLDALALAIQATKRSDAYDAQAAELDMARAVHELNLDLRDKFPNDTVAVAVSPYGTAHLRNQGIGSLM